MTGRFLLLTSQCFKLMLLTELGTACILISHCLSFLEFEVH